MTVKRLAALFGHIAELSSEKKMNLPKLQLRREMGKKRSDSTGGACRFDGVESNTWTADPGQYLLF